MKLVVHCTTPTLDSDGSMIERYIIHYNGLIPYIVGMLKLNQSDFLTLQSVLNPKYHSGFIFLIINKTSNKLNWTKRVSLIHV